MPRYDRRIVTLQGLWRQYLTDRDHFAAAALAGLLASDDYTRTGFFTEG